MQFVEFSKLYITLLRKLKDKIILRKNLPATDNYTNTGNNNVQNVNSGYGTWTNASKPYTTLPDCYHTDNGTIALELD